jgi:hypothetical protein
MKKRFFGGILVGLLTIAGTATAGTVIPFGSYTGTVAGGGTISLDVSVDGTNFDLHAENWGPVMCPIASFPVNDIPIANDGSFNYTSSTPHELASGSFTSPGRVEGTIELGGDDGSCFAGSTFEASTPVGWSDAIISAAGKTKGEDIYNIDGGPKQTLKRQVKKGKAGRFKILVENDGTIDALANVEGCKAKAATYRSGGEDVTDEVKSNNGYDFLINADEEGVAIQLKYSAKQGKTGATKRCLVNANGDSVVAVTKIIKG